MSKLTALVFQMSEPAQQLTFNGPAGLAPVYAVIRRVSDGLAWNGTGFELFNAANWQSYANFFQDQGGGQWRLVILNATLPQGDTYIFQCYSRSGATPSPSDPKHASIKAPIWGIVTPDVGGILVDHNTGGADNLRATTPGGAGVEADVAAYMTSEYGAGASPRGESRTGSDGRWLKPMKLFAGAYTFTFDAPGYTLSDVEQEVG